MPRPTLENIIAATRAGGDEAHRVLPTAQVAVAKDLGDFATEADLRAQEVIIGLLRKFSPEIPIIAEEDEHGSTLPRTFFTVDPLDGTIIASRGSDDWGTLVAYIENGQPELSVMYQPAKDRLITAARGKGCFLHGTDQSPRKLQFSREVRERLVISYELIFALSWAQVENTLRPFFAAGRIAIVRSYGAAIQAGCELALGRLDAYINVTGAKIWDFAPLALTAEECGGAALCLDSQTLISSPFTWDRIYSGAIITRTPELAAEIAAMIVKQLG